MKQFREKGRESIRQDADRRIDDRELYPHFNGAGYGTMPAWTPSSARWSIEGEIDTAADIEYPAMLTSDEGKTWALYLNTSVSFMLKYSDSLGTQYESASIAGGITGRFRLDVFPDKLVFAVNGEEYTKSIPDGILQPPGFVTAGCYGSNSPNNFFKGEFFWLRFIDHTPLQSCRVMGGNGVDRHAAIPEITLAGDFEIEVPFIYQAGVNNFIGDNDDPAGRFRADDTSLVWTRNDQGVMSAPVSWVDGAHYIAKAVKIGDTMTLYLDGVEVLSETHANHLTAIALDSIYNQNGTYTPAGGVSSTHIRDLETGDVYEYNNRNDSGNLLVNRSVRDVLGEELAKEPVENWPVEDWTDNGDGSYTLDTNGDEPNALLFVPTDQQVGKLYRVKFYLEIHSQEESGIAVQSTSDPLRGYQTATTTGWHEFDVDGDITQQFKRSNGGQAIHATISRISIRRIHALATAQGPDVSRPLSEANPGSTLKCVVTDYQDGLKVERVVDGGWDTLNLNNHPVESGKQYVIRARIRNEIPGNNDLIVLRARNSSGDQTAVEQPDSEGSRRGTSTIELRFTPYGGATMMDVLLYNKGNASLGAVYYIEQLEVRENTDGIWHEAGAPMTDAEANAARTYLPRINRTYDLSRMPEIAPDPSGLQGGYALLPESGGTIADINLSLTGDFIVEGWWRRKDRTGAHSSGLLDNSSGDGWLVTYDSGHDSVPDGIHLKSSDGSGGNFTEALSGIAQGEDFHYKFVRTGTTLELFVNGESNGTQTMTGALAFDKFGSVNGNSLSSPATVTLRDLETGHVYRYGNKNDSGDVLWNSAARDVLGAELFDASLLTTSGAPYWEVRPDGGSLNNSSGTLAYLDIPYEGLEGISEGALYQVGFEVYDLVSGGVTAYLRGAVVDNVGAEGYYSVPVKAGGSVAIDLRFASSGGELKVRNISIRRIHELGTAEGEELITNGDFSEGLVGWSQAEPEPWYVEGGVVKKDTSDVTHLTQQNILEVGKHYKIEFDYLGPNGNMNAVLGSNYVTSEVKTGQHYSLIEVCKGNGHFSLQGGGTYAVDNVSVREVTHGLWQNVDYVGPNLAVDPFQVDADWSDNEDGTYTLNDSDSSGDILSFIPSGEQAGKTFAVRFRIDALSANGISCSVANFSFADDVNVAKTTGWHEFVVSGDDIVAFKRAGGATTATLSGIVIRELNPASGESKVYRKYLPPLPKRYVKQGDVVVPSDVEGAEIWGPATKSYSPSWADNGDGSWTCDGSNAGTEILAAEITTPGRTYLLEYEVSDMSAGSLQMSVNSNGDSFGTVRSEDGVYREVLYNTGTGNNVVQVRNSAGAVFTISGIRVRETNAITFTGLEPTDWKKK